MRTPRKNVIVSVSALIGGLLMILGLILFSSGHTAHAVTGVTDPVTGQIGQVAVDADPTGNGLFRPLSLGHVVIHHPPERVDLFGHPGRIPERGHEKPNAFLERDFHPSKDALVVGP